MTRVCVLTLFALFAQAQGPQPFKADPPTVCSSCDEWNRPHAPFKVYGNTYYVGVGGLSGLLVTSDGGHILLDGGLPQSAPLIDANIRTLGFRTEDIRLIVNSHAHYDHAGGIAALRRVSNATVAASPSGARALEQGGPGEDDPQFAFGPRLNNYPGVGKARAVADGEVVRAGGLSITAHLTPGTHARQHDLDLEIVRGRSLPRHGLCRQPERRVGARFPFHRRLTARGAESTRSARASRRLPRCPATSS